MINRDFQSGVKRTPSNIICAPIVGLSTMSNKRQVFGTVEDEQQLKMH